MYLHLSEMLSADLLARLAEEFGLTTPSLVVRGLSALPPSSYELHADRALPAASLIKVPIAAALCAAWASGARAPEDHLTIQARDMTTNDAASPFVPGYAASLEELARLMITRSDNVATNTLIEELGREAATADLHTIGLTRTFIHRKLSGSDPLIEDPGKTGERNAHPARDAALLFEKIAQKKIAGADWMFNALRAQEWNEKLSTGLLAGDRFAHKTGDTSQVTHDGGILDTADGKRYVLVVYTSLASSPENDARFGAFMRALRLLL
jgi:beta-lactamase class A